MSICVRGIDLIGIGTVQTVARHLRLLNAACSFHLSPDSDHYATIGNLIPKSRSILYPRISPVDTMKTSPSTDRNLSHKQRRIRPPILQKPAQQAADIALISLLLTRSNKRVTTTRAGRGLNDLRKKIPIPNPHDLTHVGIQLKTYALDSRWLFLRTYLVREEAISKLLNRTFSCLLQGLHVSIPQAPHNDANLRINHSANRAAAAATATDVHSAPESGWIVSSSRSFTAFP